MIENEDGTVDVLDVPSIQAAWNAHTSASPQWSKTNKARGQCAVTALVVQDVLGGVLVRTVAKLPDGSEESHYATMTNLETGEILDLTESQFPEGTTFGPWEQRDRDYVLSYPATVERYMTLRQRIHEAQVLARVQIVGEAYGEQEGF